jgi:glycosyltransferase involved in cell wall biosynthesis
MSTDLLTEQLPHVSIVIPVYNSAHIIGRLLESIRELDYPPERYEVLVVDNNSTDNLEAIVAAYPVRLLYERDTQSSYAARNLGIKQARGEIVAFTDADCVVDTKWLHHLATAFQGPSIGGVAGSIKGLEPAESWIERVLNQREHLSSIDHSAAGDNGTQSALKRSFKRPKSRLSRLLNRLGLVTYYDDPRLPSFPIAPTANVAYRRETFETAGLFDATYFGGGDTEFAIRFQQQTGSKLVAAPDAVIYHRHRSTLKQLSRAYIRYSTGRVVHLERYLGSDLRIKQQIITESLAYLMVGIPWSSLKLAFRGLRSLFGPPYPHYTQDMIVNLVGMISTHYASIRACYLLSRGKEEELWTF